MGVDTGLKLFYMKLLDKHKISKSQDISLHKKP